MGSLSLTVGVKIAISRFRAGIFDWVVFVVLLQSRVFCVRDEILFSMTMPFHVFAMILFLVICFRAATLFSAAKIFCFGFRIDDELNEPS